MKQFIRYYLIFIQLIAGTILLGQPTVIKSIKFNQSISLDDISSLNYLADLQQIAIINQAEIKLFDLSTGKLIKTIHVDELNQIDEFTIYSLNYFQNKYYFIDYYQSDIVVCDINFKIVERVNIKYSKAKLFSNELVGAFFYDNEFWIPVMSNRSAYEMFDIYNPNNKSFRYSAMHPEISQYPRMSPFLRSFLYFDHPKLGILINLPYNNAVYSIKSGSKIGYLTLDKTLNLRPIENKNLDDYSETNQLERSSPYVVQTIFDKSSNKIVNLIYLPAMELGEDILSRPTEIYVYDDNFKYLYKSSNWQNKYLPVLFSSSKGVIAINYQSGNANGFDLLKF